MSEYAETMLESDLQEVLADKPAPDLSGQALQRLRESNRPAPGLPQAAIPRGRRPGWRWIAQAAGIAIVLGLIGWLVTRPDSTRPNYVAGSLAKVEAVNNGLELSEGWLLLRDGAPTVVVLDRRWNTVIDSIEGTAIAGTFYRDDIDLTATFGLDDLGNVGAQEVEKLGLTKEEKAMLPRAVRNQITTGALTLFLLSGSAVVDGIRVEADAPRPAGLRPSLKWQDEGAQPEPPPRQEEAEDGTQEWIDEWETSASYLPIHADPKAGQYWHMRIRENGSDYFFTSHRVVWMRDGRAMVESRQHNRRPDHKNYYDLTQAFVIDLGKKNGEINVLRAWVGKTGGVGRELRVPTTRVPADAGPFSDKEERFADFEMAGAKWSGRKVTRTGEGWQSAAWYADKGWFGGMIRSEGGSLVHELIAFGVNAAAPSLIISEELQVDAQSPRPDDIPGIKAMLGNVSAVSLRAMDEDMNWRGWMHVEAAADVQTLRKAFADNLKAKSVKIAGYDHLNEFMLQLKDGRTVGASVYTYVGAADGSGGRVDLTFPDQKGSTQYDADPALLKAVQPWLDRAAKVDPVGTSQAESVARLLRTAEKLVVNYNGHFLTVDSREEVRRVMEALTSAGFTASDRDLSFKDPWDWVTIHLPGGLKANAIGLSQGPATYKGFFDLRIPDWPEHNAFTIPEAALPLLKDLFDRAAKQPKEDPGNPPAMRAWLGRARKVTFRDDFDKKAPVEGTLTTRPDLASLAAIVWPDGIVEVADDQGTSRTVLQLTWHMEGGEALACEICDNGWLAMRVPGPGDLLFRMIPASHPGLIHELLARQGKAATPLPVSVLRSWAGPNSGVKKARAEILVTEEQWKKTWAEHDPAAELPKIDFEREMVVAVFDGDSWNSRGFYARELLAGDNGATVIRVDEHTYQTMGEGDRVTPFGIFVITRTGRTLTVEENAQSIIGKPPLWKPLTARIEMFSDLPALDKVFAKYQAAQSWVGKGGRGVEQFRSAINADEWKDLWDEITPSHPGANVLPEIDWSKHVAVAVSGKIMEGLGDYSFTYVGANGSRTVLRLHTPTAQTDGAPPVMENRYAIWVLPRPAGSLVVETPRFGRLDQPPSWLEEHVVKVR